ncbi:hypothetical protein [Herbaspirillum robiniae]|uniref:hypothetical protein n=1 Tax=Herbaspirillum robiniae TaxID=2014887 RepID=UPI00101AE730|nr:hypothetical protein [Herbaspirillum robiniae]
MNLALPALVVFLILLPGFLFRSRFKHVELTSLDYSPFGEVVVEATTWAAILHAIWIAGAAFFFENYFDIGILLKLISAHQASQADAIKEISGKADQVEVYFASIIFGAYVIPTVLRWGIKELRLDRIDSFAARYFRFHKAPWYYLLTGADFSEEEQPDFIYISAIVDVAGDAVLYKGILDEFFVNADGVLDRLILQDVSRRPIGADKSAETADGLASADSSATASAALPQSRFYPVDGDYFVLRYSEAITLNIQYIKL